MVVRWCEEGGGGLLDDVKESYGPSARARDRNELIDFRVKSHNISYSNNNYLCNVVTVIII